jgi:hypothetical protein
MLLLLQVSSSITTWRQPPFQTLKWLKKAPRTMMELNAPATSISYCSHHHFPAPPKPRALVGAALVIIISHVDNPLVAPFSPIITFFVLGDACPLALAGS